ncbi:MAG: FAD-binding protein [Pseudomonadota bacterium]
MVHEGGLDPVHGCGEHNDDSENLLEELDLMALNPRLRAKLERQREQEKNISREQLEELVRLFSQGSVFVNESTANHSAARVGGAVEAFVTTNDMDELKRAIAWANELSIEYRFWGTGSFTLVRDGGLSGILIKLGDGFKDIAVERSFESEVFVSAGAGTKVYEFTSFCKAQGISGAEQLCGAQGTLGGLLCAQASPDGKTLEGMVEEITIITREGRELTLRGSGLRFEEGRLKIPRTSCVTKALFKLSRACDSVIARSPSTLLRAGSCDEAIPYDTPCFALAFKSPCKTSAQILIDEAGLTSVRVGNARVSAENACTIQNEGDATAKDIIVLISLIKDRVKQASGILLVSTIDIVGKR